MVEQVLFSRDGKFLAASYFAPTSGNISVWSVADWQRVQQIENPKVGRLRLAPSREEGSFFYLTKSFGLSQIVKIRPEQKDQQEETFVVFDPANNPPLIFSIAPYSDNRYFIYHTGGPIRIIKRANGKEDTPEALIKATYGLCRAFTVSEDGKWLACYLSRLDFGTSPHGRDWVVLWDLVKQEQLAAWPPWPEHRVRLTSIALSPDKKMLAVGNGKGRSFQGKQQAGEVVLYDLTKLQK